MNINKIIMKKLEKKYMMPLNSLIYNLSTFIKIYEEEISKNDLDSIKIALEYIKQTVGE